jgi:hypothetical protein
MAAACVHVYACLKLVSALKAGFGHGAAGNLISSGQRPVEIGI